MRRAQRTVDRAFYSFPDDTSIVHLDDIHLIDPRLLAGNIFHQFPEGKTVFLIKTGLIRRDVEFLVAVFLRKHISMLEEFSCATHPSVLREGIHESRPRGYAVVLDIIVFRIGAERH